MPPVKPVEAPAEVAFTTSGEEPWPGIRVTCSDQGITTRRFKTIHSYSWNDVEKLSIMRCSRYHDDFYRLCITLPGQELVRRGHAHAERAWKEPMASVLAAFLLKHVPPNRVVESFDAERASTRAQLQERRQLVMKRAAEHHRDVRQMTPVLILVLVLWEGKTLWDAWNELRFETAWEYWNLLLRMSLIPAAVAFSYLFIWLVAREYRKRLAQLDQQESELLEQEPRGPSR